MWNFISNFLGAHLRSPQLLDVFFVLDRAACRVRLKLLPECALELNLGGIYVVALELALSAQFRRTELIPSNVSPTYAVISFWRRAELFSL